MVVFLAKAFLWIVLLFILSFVIYWVLLKRKNQILAQQEQELRVYVIGETGKGKTLLLVSLVENLIKKKLEEKNYHFNLNYLDDQQERNLREIQVLGSSPNQRSTKTLVEMERALFEQEQASSTPTKKPEDVYLKIKYKTQSQNKELLCHFVDLPGSYFEDTSNPNAHHQLKETIQSSDALIFVINAMDLNLSSLDKPLTHYHQYSELIDHRLTQKSIPIVVAITQADRLSIFQADHITQQKKAYFSNWLKHQELYESTAIYDLYSAKRNSIYHARLEELAKNLVFHLIDQHENTIKAHQAQEQSLFSRYAKITCFALLLIGILINILTYQSFKSEILGMEKEAIHINSLKEHHQKIKEGFSSTSVWIVKKFAHQKLQSLRPAMSKRLIEDELKQADILVKQLNIFSEDYKEKKTKLEDYLSKIEAMNAFFNGFQIKLLEDQAQKRIDEIYFILEIKKEYEKIFDHQKNEINEKLSLSVYLKERADIFRENINAFNNIHEKLKNYQIEDQNYKDHIESYDLDMINDLLLNFNKCVKCENAAYFDHEDLTNTISPLIYSYPLVAFHRSDKLKKKQEVIQLNYHQIEDQLWKSHWNQMIDHQNKFKKNNMGIIEITKNLRQFKKKLFELQISMPKEMQDKYLHFVNELISSYQPESLDKYPSEKANFEKDNLLWLQNEAGNIGSIQIEFQQLQYDFNQKLKELLMRDLAMNALDAFLNEIEHQANQFNQYQENERKVIEVKVNGLLQKIKDIRALRQRSSYQFAIEQIYCDASQIDPSYNENNWSTLGVDNLSTYMRLIQSNNHTQEQKLFYYSFDIADQSKDHIKHTFEISWTLYDQFKFEILDEDLGLDDITLSNDDILEVKINDQKKKLEFHLKNALSLYQLIYLKEIGGCHWQFKVSPELKPWLFEFMFQGK
jgi:hypothetical protein